MRCIFVSLLLVFHLSEHCSLSIQFDSLVTSWKGREGIKLNKAFANIFQFYVFLLLMFPCLTFIIFILCIHFVSHNCGDKDKNCVRMWPHLHFPRVGRSCFPVMFSLYYFVKCQNNSEQGQLIGMVPHLFPRWGEVVLPICFQYLMHTGQDFMFVWF